MQSRSKTHPSTSISSLLCSAAVMLPSILLRASLLHLKMGGHFYGGPFRAQVKLSHITKTKNLLQGSKMLLQDKNYSLAKIH